MGIPTWVYPGGTVCCTGGTVCCKREDQVCIPRWYSLLLSEHKYVSRDQKFEPRDLNIIIPRDMII